MPKPIKVLIADDNPDDVALMVRELRTAGFEPAWQRVDTEEAYSEHLRDDLDLVLCDFQMPQFTGLRALEILRRQAIDVPFILVSGTIGEEIAVAAMRAGASDYILKDRLMRLGLAVEQALVRGRMFRESKRVAVALATSERRFRSMLQGVEAGVVVRGSDSGITAFNAKALELLHTTAAQMEGRTAFDPGWMLVRADGSPLTEDELPFHVVWRTRQPVRDVVIGLQLPERVGLIWLLVSANPVLTVTGEVAEVILTFIDVTARTLAEQSVRDGASFTDAVLNALTAGVVVLDEAGNITATNEAWRRYGRENGGVDCLRQNYLKVCATSVFHSGDPHALLAAEGIRSVLDGVKPDFRLEYPCDSPTEKRWVMMHVSPLAGNRQGVVVAHEDITELKRTEEALRESEEKFRRMIENSSDVIALTNRSGVIQYQSPSTQRLLGYRTEEILGADLLSFVHPEDCPRVVEGILRVVSGSVPAPMVEYRVRHCDGKWRLFQSIGRAMSDSPDEELVVINSRDVTDTRKLEQQFLRAQRMEAIGTLSSGIAHDLNNILSPMLMIVPILSGKLADPQDRELLVMIERGAQRGADVIKQILAFSRGVDGERGFVQARYLVKEMVAIIRETFPREITVEDDIASDLWPINADATQIHQVLMNLCVNARDAMAAGGKIVLAAGNVIIDEAAAALHPPTKAGPFIRLSVSDRGEGISRENLSRIFEPFFTTKAMGKGTGLGLSTVRGIVRGHGGFIEVYSEPGRGTSFKVLLPAIVDAVDAGAPAAIPPPPGRGELILVVDDEIAIRRTLCLSLQKNNYAVLAAGTGLEALTLYEANRDRIRLVLTDVMMPGMNGVALVRMLRARDPSLRFIAATGLNDDERCAELAALGVTSIFAKPFGTDKMLEAVHRELMRVT